MYKNFINLISNIIFIQIEFKNPALEFVFGQLIFWHKKKRPQSYID